MPKLPSAPDLIQDVPNVTRPIIAPGPVAATAVPRATQQLGRSTQFLSQKVYQEQQKMDNLRAEDALNQAKKQALDLSIGENGFATIKGENVLKRPIRKEYNERLTKSLESIEKGLDNPNQIGMFRRRSQPVSQNYQANLTRHVRGELDEYQNKTDVATIDIETKEAAANWADPGAVAGSRERVLFTVNSAADRQGLSGESRKKFVNDQMTKLHAGVLDAMMVNNIDLARKYYAKTKQEINGDTRTVIENKLQQSSLKADAQALTDKVIGMEMSDTETLAYVRQHAKNPDVRSASVDLVKERFVERDYREKEAVEAAERYVGEHQTLEGLPDEVESLLTASNRNALQTHARNLRQGIEPNQDWEKWTEFVGTMEKAIAGDEAAKSKAKGLDPIKDLRPYLDNGHYDKALGMVTDYRLGKMADVTGKTERILTNQAAMDNFLNILFEVEKNGDRTKDDNQFANIFYSVAQARFDAWSAENKGARMPGTVRNEIMRELMEGAYTQKAGTLTTFFLGKHERALADIPTDDLRIVVYGLQQDGEPLTGDNITRAYYRAKELGVWGDLKDRYGEAAMRSSYINIQDLLEAPE